MVALALMVAAFDTAAMGMQPYASSYYTGGRGVEVAGEGAHTQDARLRGCTGAETHPPCLVA